MEQHERLRKARREAGYKTAADAARALGIPYPTYANHENASKSGFKSAEGRQYARKFKVSFQWLMTGDGEPRPPGLVPIVGHVGAGAEVFPNDDYPKGRGLDLVDPPPGAPSGCVAVIIRGDSMHPFEDGWLIFYRRDQEGVPDDCVNRLCVVKVNEGPMLVKKVLRGRSHKLWNLESYNASLRENVRLDWAARVLDIRPR